MTTAIAFLNLHPLLPYLRGECGEPVLAPCCCRVPSVKQNIREVLGLFCLHSFFINLTARLSTRSAMSKTSPWLISQPLKTKADSFHPAPFRGRPNRKKETGDKKSEEARSRRPSHITARCCQTDPSPLSRTVSSYDQTSVYLLKLFIYLTECIKSINSFVKSTLINPFPHE